MWRFFGNAKGSFNQRSPSANVTPRSAATASSFTADQLGKSQTGGLSWSGSHPRLPHSVYGIRTEKVFRRVLEVDDATHELFVWVALQDSKRLPANEVRERLLLRRQSNLWLPGMAPDDVASRLVLSLRSFLLQNPNPRDVPGMYFLLPERRKKHNPWETQVNEFWRGLLKSQLIICRESINDYLDDPLYITAKHMPNTAQN